MYGRKDNNLIFLKLFAAYQFIENESNCYKSKRTSAPLLGLKEIIKYSWQIEKNEIVSPILGNEILDILENFLEIVICDMGIETTKVEESFKNCSFDKLHSKKIFQEDSFELAIHLIAELLQEWVQATRMIYEAPIYNIQFINSSNKIYICYYTIVELIEQALIENFIDLENGHLKPNYFTMIHHADKIKSHLLFPEARASKQLIPIRLTREFFFSPTTSIPYIIHEIGHYVSPNIPLRNQSFFLTVCGDIAKEIFFGTVIGLWNEYIFELIKTEWNDKSEIIQKKLSERIKYEFESISNDSKKMSFMNEGNFECYCVELKKYLSEIFGFVNYEVFSASNALNDSIENYFITNPTLIENKIKIERLANWLIDIIERGEDVSDVMELLQLWLKKLKDFQKIESALQRLVEVYESKKKKIFLFAEDLAKIILFGISEDPPLIKTLIETTNSSQEKRNLANYFASKRVHENTSRNVQAVKQTIYNFITQKSFIWKIDFYNDLFIETTADLLMIYLLGISLEEYEKIIDDASQIQNYQNGQNLTYAAQSARTQLIKNNWGKFTQYESKSDQKDLKDINIDINNFVEGIPSDDLIDYLEKVVIKLSELCDQSDLVELKSTYKILKMSQKNGGAKGTEIKFVEGYYLKRLLLFSIGENKQSGNS